MAAAAHIDLNVICFVPVFVDRMSFRMIDKLPV